MTYQYRSEFAKYIAGPVDFSNAENSFSGARMRARLRASVIGVIAACGMLPKAACSDATPPTDRPPLIPRSELFSPPPLRDPRLSPDGRRLAYVAPDPSGVDNLWIRDLDATRSSRVTHASTSGIQLLRWAEDPRYVLYRQDSGGNEADHVYALDVDTLQARDLTPFPAARAQNVLTSLARPGEILVGMNLRDPQIFDMYRINLATGASSLDTENAGDVLSWVTDARFEIRAATAFDPMTAQTILRTRQSRAAPWREIARCRFEDSLMFGQVSGGSAIAGFGPADRTLYAVSAATSETGQLVELDAASGEVRRVIAADSKSDVAADPTAAFQPRVMIDPLTHEVEGVGFEFERWRWEALEDAVSRDLDTIARRYDGFPIVVSRDGSNRHWVLEVLSDHLPPRFVLLDRHTRRSELLGPQGPAARAGTFVESQPVIVTARDGRKLQAYLTLPRAPSGRVPFVVLAHGGPWARDDWDFDPTVQWLANRGYGVIRVNFRGSTGFGKSVLNAGNRQFGLAMQDDLEDGAVWSVEHSVADPDHLAIMGFSGGGYAALRGLSRTPGRYACGVDVVGPSDLGALLTSFAPWMKAVRTRWVRRLGDLEHDELLQHQLSPVFHARDFTAPVFIAQGLNDARVAPLHAERMVAALRDARRTVTYVTYADEGHNFERQANVIDLYGRMEEFLGTCLHGRVQ
jgi:dipeptidyl aminopeptidase/acylaminoacyl peptidase